MIAMRLAQPFARLVLAWFVLSMSFAAASIQVMPRSMQLQVVCSIAGAEMRMVSTDGGVQDSGVTHLDCPLCLSSGVPPPKLVLGKTPLNASFGPSLQPTRSAYIAAAASAPLPARGPPTLA